MTVTEARRRLASAGWQSLETHDESRFGLGGYYNLVHDDPEWVICSQHYAEFIDGTRSIDLDSAPSCTVTLPNLVGSTLGDVYAIADATGIVCEQQPPPGPVDRKVEDSLFVGLTPPGADC